MSDYPPIKASEVLSYAKLRIYHTVDAKRSILIYRKAKKKILIVSFFSFHQKKKEDVQHWLCSVFVSGAPKTFRVFGNHDQGSGRPHISKPQYKRQPRSCFSKNVCVDKELYSTTDSSNNVTGERRRRETVHELLL